MPASRIGMACQFRRLEDVVAPSRFRNLAGQIAFQQKTLLRSERSRCALMIQSKRVKQISGQVRDIEVDRHVRCPLTVQRTTPKIGIDFGKRKIKRYGILCTSKRPRGAAMAI